MKLIFAVLDVSLTMGLTRCYKTEGFLHLYLQFYTSFTLLLFMGARMQVQGGVLQGGALASPPGF